MEVKSAFMGSQHFSGPANVLVVTEEDCISPESHSSTSYSETISPHFQQDQGQTPQN